MSSQATLCTPSPPDHARDRRAYALTSEAEQKAALADIDRAAAFEEETADGQAAVTTQHQEEQAAVRIQASYRGMQVRSPAGSRSYPARLMPACLPTQTCLARACLIASSAAAKCSTLASRHQSGLFMSFKACRRAHESARCAVLRSKHRSDGCRNARPAGAWRDCTSNRVITNMVAHSDQCSKQRLCEQLRIARSAPMIGHPPLS